MPSEEVLDVGGVDPPSRAELIAGQLATPDPVPDGPVTDREEVGEGPLGEEARLAWFPLHATYVQDGRGLHRLSFRRISETEGQTPTAPPYRRPPHGEAVPQSAARRGGRVPIPQLEPEARQRAAQARIRRVRSVSGVEVGGSGTLW